MDAEPLVRPVVEGAGLELVELSYHGARGRRVLRVTVDRDGGVDLESIATISEKLTRRLDLEDFGEGAYQLEVSSPGLERPLRTPAQFARCIGWQVDVRTVEPVEGSSVHVGTLVGSDDRAIDVEVDGEVRRLGQPQIASARTVVDWAAELKGTHA
ncbi:MAG: ribosome maturation factor RimP [Actinomycetota bacterium]|nr:ribosome maturation factor RimP [Actinomycetota bacterium]